MKRGIINTLMALAASATMIFVGCNEVPEEVTPIFPEKTTASVEAGEEYEFSFDANMAWSLAIPDDVATYFKFIVGESELYSLSGEAGTHTVTVGVSDIEEFNTVRVCEISMTMGNETKVIAEITRGGKERTLAMYVVENYVDEETGDTIFSTDADGNYIYSSTPAERLDWVWSNEQWMQRVAIEANFEWYLSPDAPEWLSLNASEGTVGRTELFLRVDREKLPLEDVICNVEFGVIYLINSIEGGFEAIGSYPTTMEGCKDIFEVDLTSAQFNAAGEYYLASSDVYTEFANLTTNSPRGAELVVLNKSANGSYTTEGADWIVLTTNEDFAEEAGDYGVWKRTFTLNTTANTSTDSREGAIAAIPVSAAGTNSYEEYIVCTITQEGVVEESVPDTAIYAYDNEVFAAYNSKFEDLASNSWPYQGAWAKIPYAYKMTYQSNNTDNNDLDLVFTTAFSRYEIYGYDGQYGDKYDLESCWISIEPSEEYKEIENGYMVHCRLNETINGVKYTNTMAGPDGENDATIIFYDSNDVAFALVYFVLDPTYSTPIERPEGGVFFADDSYALLGATLEEITPSDDEYSAELAFGGTLQYRLTLNPNCNEVVLSVPDYLMSLAYAEWIITSDSTQSLTVTIDPSVLPTGSTTYSSHITVYGTNNYNVAVKLIVVYNLQ